MLIVSIDKLADLGDELYNLAPDVIELRLDLLPEKDLLAVQNSPLLLPLPLLIAIKPNLNRSLDLASILKNLQPELIDLDHSLFTLFEPIIKKIYPQGKIIVSKHSTNIFEIEKFFKKHPQVHLKKLVIETENTLLALKIACLSKKKNLILFASGKNTSFTRFFSKWHYCYFKTPTAEGQFSLESLKNLYTKANNISSFLALIGDPVSHSLSHITHNYILKLNDIDYVYLKIPLKSHHLKQGLNYLKQLRCRGLSITSPHKQEVYNIVSLRPYLKSINTWDFKNKTSINTDTLVIKNILKKIQPESSILLVGNGACSKAFQIFFNASLIRYSLWHRQKKIKLLPHYDVIINATSSEDPLEVLPTSKLLINLFHQNDSPLIEKKAKSNRSEVLGGKTFFFLQAEHQLAFFFKKNFHLDENQLLPLVKLYKES